MILDKQNRIDDRPPHMCRIPDIKAPPYISFLFSSLVLVLLRTGLLKMMMMMMIYVCIATDDSW